MTHIRAGFENPLPCAESLTRLGMEVEALGFHCSGVRQLAGRTLERGTWTREARASSQRKAAASCRTPERLVIELRRPEQDYFIPKSLEVENAQTGFSFSHSDVARVHCCPESKWIVPGYYSATELCTEARLQLRPNWRQRGLFEDGSRQDTDRV